MWRFYAQRAKSGLWLDTNVQLKSPVLKWQLSSPNTGTAIYLKGLDPAGIAEDGRPVFGKWDTLLYAEEDGELTWFGVCSATSPKPEGQQLEFTGFMGWLAGVPYTDRFREWRTNAFDIVRHLVDHGKTHTPRLPIQPTGNNSNWYLGDEQPPNKPKEPSRRKGETKSEWKNSRRYKNYLEDLQEWNDKYGDREPYEIAWFEAPYCGEEIDTIMKETGSEYRELVEWTDRGKLDSRLILDLQDTFNTRRQDIEFVDGMNIAKKLDPKNDEDVFANHVIALGAGEGRKMRRVSVGQDDGRLFQGEYMQYKHVKNLATLRSLAEADHKRLSNTTMKVETVVVRDVAGYASIRTLRVGDEVKVRSPYTTPTIDVWSRILAIQRGTQESVATITVEVAE